MLAQAAGRKAVVCTPHTTHADSLCLLQTQNSARLLDIALASKTTTIYIKWLWGLGSTIHIQTLTIFYDFVAQRLFRNRNDSLREQLLVISKLTLGPLNLRERRAFPRIT